MTSDMNERSRPKHAAACSATREDQLVAQTDALFFELHNSFDGIIWSSTVDGYLDYANRYFTEYTGQSKLGTLAWTTWSDLIHPDDLNLVSDAVLSSLSSHICYEVHCRLLSKEGAYHPFLLRGVIMRGSNGRVYRWVGSASRTDLTDPNHCSKEEINSYVMGLTNEQRMTSGDVPSQERLARRLEFLAEASELASSLEVQDVLQSLARLAVPRMGDWVGVLQLHPEGVLSTIAHFHRDPGLAHLGWAISLKFPPTEEPRYGSFYTLKTGEAQILDEMSESTLETLARTKDLIAHFKQLGTTSVIVAPLKANGRMIGTVSFGCGTSGRHYDESDRLFAQEVAQRLAQALEHSRLYREAQKINQIKDDFLATLSHELRTPLNVILGHSELLLSNWPTISREDEQSSLAAIHRNARSQSQLVNDLLDTSAMILGKIRLSPTRVSLQDLIHETINSLSMGFHAKNIRPKITIKRNPTPVLVDADRLQQVMMNLLVNAMKYTPQGGSIEVILEQMVDQIHITVTDSGIGIDPGFLPFVFDRFRQEHSGISRSFGGLGLGLSIARSLVELHDGTIEVHSDGHGHGSRFTVILPRRDEPTATLGRDTISRESLSHIAERRGELPSLRNTRILIVEDDPDTRKLMKRFLEGSDAEVIEADSASEGFQLLWVCHPELILSDIGMPGEDGFHFIRNVRSAEKKLNRFTPAAALTAFSRPEDGERALAAGFQAHIAKPVSRDRLIFEVSKVLTKHRSLVTSWTS